MHPILKPALTQQSRIKASPNAQTTLNNDAYKESMDYLANEMSKLRTQSTRGVASSTQRISRNQSLHNYAQTQQVPSNSQSAKQLINMLSQTLSSSGGKKYRPA